MGVGWTGANSLCVCAALITISTRASLKKYHTYNLVLGLGERGDEWEFQRIGTEHEKMHVEREVHELRERLAQVDKWKARRDEIDRELAKVWVEGGEEMPAPSYVQVEKEEERAEGEEVAMGEKEVEKEAEEEKKEETAGQEEKEEGKPETVEQAETEADETQDEAEYQEAQEVVAQSEAETEVGEETTPGEGSTVVV